MRRSWKKLLPLRVRRTVKIRRAHLFESFGSRRYAYPALNGLDRKVYPFLPDRPGTFLEIGANDGYSQSNTYFLERLHGWRGILIEPLPSLFRTCRRIRPSSRCFNTACVAPGTEADHVRIVDLDLMSVTLDQQDPSEQAARLRDRHGRLSIVPATALSHVIDEAGSPTIDFMSVDVEGAEIAVLSGLDLTRHTPRLLLVETNHPEDVVALLSSTMQLKAKLSHHDYLFESV